MNDIPPTLQEQLKPLFLKKDIYSGKLCENGKEIRRIRLELMKEGKIPGDVLRRSQSLIDETTYLTTKLRALEREIDGVLTQEMLRVDHSESDNRVYMEDCGRKEKPCSQV